MVDTNGQVLQHLPAGFYNNSVLSQQSTSFLYREILSGD